MIRVFGEIKRESTVVAENCLMGWYSTLKAFIKLADAKQKILQYGIRSPILQYFITKYENQVPWNGYSVENPETGEIIQKKIFPPKNLKTATEEEIKAVEESIQEGIKAATLPKVLIKMEKEVDGEPNPASYLMKEYDVEKHYNEAKLNNIHNPELDHAYMMHQQDQHHNQRIDAEIAKIKADAQQRGVEVDPKDLPKRQRSGEAFYLERINRQKLQVYEGWKEFLLNHQEYSKNPAFIFMFLNKILDFSDDTQEKPPPAANPIVIAQMFQKIMGVTYKYDGPIKDKAVYEKVLALTKQTLGSDKIAAQLNIPVEKVKDVLSLKGTKTNEIANAVGLPQQTVLQIINLSKETKPAAEIAAETGLPVEHIQGVIDQNMSGKIDIGKAYQKDLADHCLKVTRQAFDPNTKSGWIKFPMKDNVQPGVDEKGNPMTKEQVWEKNIDVLTNFSVPNQWCTTRDRYGPSYLSEGDFWTLVEDGKACVGIRFGNKNASIEEIAGDQSYAGGVSRSCPTSYWREITDIIYREGLEPKITGHSAQHHWKMILKERELNKSYFNEDGTPNMEEIDLLVDRIKKDPMLYNSVMKNENFEKFPDILQALQDACKTAWFKKIEAMGGDDAFKLAGDVAAAAGQMPDFVLRDPAFIENVHGRLSVMYQNSPERVREVLGKVPNHWEMYPRGKEIFKTAVLRKYGEGIYWKSNVFSTSRKSKDMKTKIMVAKKELGDIQSAISDFLPDLNDDVEFQSSLERAKAESAGSAMSEGYFAQDMPREMVEQYFDDMANVEMLAQKISDKMCPAGVNVNSMKRDHSVYLEKTFNKEFSALAPIWMRKLPGFQNFAAKVKQTVLERNIDMFSKFDQQNQTDELYEKFYQYIENQGALTQSLINKQNLGDRLTNDPRFKAKVQAPDQKEIDEAIREMYARASIYLELPPHIQQDERIINEYLNARARSENDLDHNMLTKEFPRLPDFLKKNAELAKAYINACLRLLKHARVGHKYYIDCSKLDPVAYTSPEIIEACRNRKTPVPAEMINHNMIVEAPADQGDIEFGGPAQQPQQPQQPPQPPMAGPGQQGGVVAYCRGWYRKASIVY